MILELSLCHGSYVDSCYAWVVFSQDIILKSFGRLKYSNRTVIKIQLPLILTVIRVYNYTT